MEFGPPPSHKDTDTYFFANRPSSAE